MARISIIYSRLSYGSGTTLAGYDVSVKAHIETARTAKEVLWMLADKTAGLSLNGWAIIVGTACIVITCAVDWYYGKREREDRFNGNVIKAEE